VRAGHNRSKENRKPNPSMKVGKKDSLLYFRLYNITLVLMLFVTQTTMTMPFRRSLTETKPLKGVDLYNSLKAN